MKKRMRMTMKIEKTFKDGCEDYLLDCKARNLREGTLKHYTDVDVDEIFDIMCDFTDVEHTMLNLIIVCNVLAEHYNGTEYNKFYAFVSMLGNQLDMIQKGFRRVINKVDELLLEKK